MRGAWRPGGLAAVAMMALAACGRGGSQEGTGDAREEVRRTARIKADFVDVDACSLLTGEEIRQATGVEPATGTPQSPVEGSAPMCVWSSADGQTFQLVHLLVTRTDYGSYDEYLKSVSDAMGADYAAGNYRRVEGPGSFDVWMEDAALLQSFGDGVLVQVRAEATPGHEALDSARALAGDVRSRLRNR